MAYSDLRALFINCTLKRSPETSNTQGARRHLDRDHARAGRRGRDRPRDRPPDRDRRLAGHDASTAGTSDDWPAIHEKVMAADILVLCTPIWLGEKSSVCTQVIERLYGNSHLLNEAGQYAYYGRVGGCLVTGNEDGVKHCAMNILYSLQHLGYTIPPQADAGWIGEAGPGPSYLDPGSGGPENDFTNRNTHFMTWNLLHLARMLKDAGGIPAHGNQRAEWDAGCALSNVPTPSTADRTDWSSSSRTCSSSWRSPSPRRCSLGLAPRLRVPAVVLEIVAGIAVGPSVLGLGRDRRAGRRSSRWSGSRSCSSSPARDRRRPAARPRCSGSPALGFVAVVRARAGRRACARGRRARRRRRCFVAIALAATSLGIVVPVLKDARRGRVAVRPARRSPRASIADFATIILLSLLFSREARRRGVDSSPARRLFALVVAAGRRWRSPAPSARRADPAVLRPPPGHDRADPGARRVPAARRVRRAGERARARDDPRRVPRRRDRSTLVDRDEAMTHPSFRAQARGDRLRVLHPGVLRHQRLRFDLDALLDARRRSLRPALPRSRCCSSRGLPALLYRPLVGRRAACVAAGLLQATSLPFIVAATAIGLELGVIDAAGAAVPRRRRPALGRHLPGARRRTVAR